MELLVLNTKFESIAVVDTYESLIWTDRYNQYGDFEIYFAMDKKLLDIFKQDYYLWLNESEHLMIIENIKINSDVEEGNHLVVTGRSLESILERRIVWGQVVLKGGLQDSIKTLINDNIISPSDNSRKITNFKFVDSTDSKITELNMEHQYTGDDLYSIIKGLCSENQIGFKITLSDDNEFTFTLYSGEDRSYVQETNPYVVFSPNFENIISSNYLSSKANYKNVTLVAGEGEGSDRKTYSVGDTEGLDRREIFTDARDISSTTESGTLSTEDYNAQLKTRGENTLHDYEISSTFEGQVEATHLFKYGTDFFIGDIVQITDEYGNEGAVYISELIISQNQEGLSIYPTFETYEKKEETK